jgi:hypothetical protein
MFCVRLSPWPNYALQRTRRERRGCNRCVPCAGSLILSRSIPNMHPLIEQAKQTIAAWTNDEPRELAIAVAALCRETLDAGGLPTDSPDWARLRNAFDVVEGQDIGDTIVKWDQYASTEDVDLSNQVSFVKLGIVTWLVKFLAKRLGMLPGSQPINDFAEWKGRLCDCFDKYILVSPNRTSGCT